MVTLSKCVFRLRGERSVGIKKEDGAFIALNRLLDNNDKIIDGKNAMKQLKRIYEQTISISKKQNKKP